MTWTKLDDGLWRSPKFAGLTDRAFRLYVVALNWSCDQLTDGRIREGDLATLTSFMPLSTSKRGRLAVVSTLLDHGLWLETSDGWAIQDFADFQPTRAQVLATRTAKQAAAAKGNHARWHSTNPVPECEYCPPETATEPIATASHLRSTTDSTSDPVPTPPDPTRPGSGKTTASPRRMPPLVVAVAAESNIEPADLERFAIAQLARNPKIKNANAVWFASFSKNRGDLEAAAAALIAQRATCSCPNGPTLEVVDTAEGGTAVNRRHAAECPTIVAAT